IFTHNLADFGLRPAGAIHGSGQIGKVADPAHPRRVDDIVERAGYPPPMSVVMANILEKIFILILGEVGPDPDIVLARNTDHVLYRREIILDGRIVSPGEEGRKHTPPDNPAMFDYEADLLIGLVARMGLQSCPKMCV